MVCGFVTLGWLMISQQLLHRHLIELVFIPVAIALFSGVMTLVTYFKYT